MGQKSPLKRAPNRLPGQSVDDELAELRDLSLEKCMFILLMAAGIGFAWVFHLSETRPNPVLITVVFSLAIVWSVSRLLPIRKKSRLLKLGRDGERAVGQFLERSRALGYHVYHDLLFEEGNIDHVLVGPGGVFTIETKTWSKPSRGRPVIKYDGGAESLTKDGLDVSAPLIQAKAQANAVRGLISEYSSNSLYVRPVVVFPGWYIESRRTRPIDVWVLEPKALLKWVENAPSMLTDEEIGAVRQILDRHVSPRK